jgi:hypothetical protein
MVAGWPKGCNGGHLQKLVLDNEPVGCTAIFFVPVVTGIPEATLREVHPMAGYDEPLRSCPP